MSTIIFQQAQNISIDPPHLLESTTVRLKLVTPQPPQETAIFEGWSLLQSLYSPKPTNDSHHESSYVHPLVHQSSVLKLSQKSLELCTESLGSESGSEDDAVFTSPVTSSPATRRQRDHVESKKAVSTRSFPPPLTTMSGSKVFQVRPHREGGRLIIEAMEAPLMNSCFQAERSHGRLRLTCWTNGEEGDCDRRSVEDEEEMKGRNGGGDGEEMGVEKFQRLRRCKEDGLGDKGIISCNWEPCWLATS